MSSSAEMRTQGGGQFAGPLLIWGWKILYSCSVENSQPHLCVAVAHRWHGTACEACNAVQWHSHAGLPCQSNITCHMLSVHHHCGMQTSVWYVTAVMCTQTCDMWSAAITLSPMFWHVQVQRTIPLLLNCATRNLHKGQCCLPQNIWMLMLQCTHSVCRRTAHVPEHQQGAVISPTVCISSMPIMQK